MVFVDCNGWCVPGIVTLLVIYDGRMTAVDGNYVWKRVPWADACRNRNHIKCFLVFK